jgi:hypothetical protein
VRVASRRRQRGILVVRHRSRSRTRAHIIPGASGAAGEARLRLRQALLEDAHSVLAVPARYSTGPLGRPGMRGSTKTGKPLACQTAPHARRRDRHESRQAVGDDEAARSTGLGQVRGVLLKAHTRSRVAAPRCHRARAKHVTRNTAPRVVRGRADEPRSGSMARTATHRGGVQVGHGDGGLALWSIGGAAPVTAMVVCTRTTRDPYAGLTDWSRTSRAASLPVRRDIHGDGTSAEARRSRH